MKIAWLFPGQGSQTVGMAKDICERFDAAARVFEVVDAALGYPLSDLCFNGPEDELQRTTNLQPALVATSSAILAALRQCYPGLTQPSFGAGHSLGEYSALVAAGALPVEDAVRIVRLRGQAMQDAVPEGEGAMLALIGGTPDAAHDLCSEASQGQVLSPANFNSPGQVVIAGAREAVDRARQLAKTKRLRAIPLKVSAPFHCSLMRPAAERMRVVLGGAHFGTPEFPVFANVDAKPNHDPARIADLLTRQIEGAVQWEQIVLGLAAAGVTHALEIGPGKVLAGLVAKTTSEVQVLSVSDLDSLASVEAFLR